MPIDEKILNQLKFQLKANDPKLTRLDLTDELLTQDDAKALADALANNTNLEYLDVNYHEFTFAGLQLLANALALNKGLIRVNFAYCYTAPVEVLNLFAAALEKNTTLLELCFGEKIGLDYEEPNPHYAMDKEKYIRAIDDQNYQDARNGLMLMDKIPYRTWKTFGLLDRNENKKKYELARNSHLLGLLGEYFEDRQFYKSKEAEKLKLYISGGDEDIQLWITATCHVLDQKVGDDTYSSWPLLNDQKPEELKKYQRTHPDFKLDKYKKYSKFKKELQAIINTGRANIKKTDISGVLAEPIKKIQQLLKRNQPLEAPTTTTKFEVKCDKTLNLNEYYITGLTVLPDGRLAGFAGKTIELWDVESGKCVTLDADVNDIPADITVLRVLPDGRLASGSSHGTIKLWDTESRKCMSLNGHTGSVKVLTVLPDGRLASGSSDATIKLWDVKSGKCVTLYTPQTPYKPKYTPHTPYKPNVVESNDVITDLIVLPNGLLASKSGGETIRFWNVQSRECVRILRDPGFRFFPLTVLPNGHLFSVSGGNSIKVWDANSGECIRTLHDPNNSGIGRIAVLPNGYLASMTNPISPWDMQLGGDVKSLGGYQYNQNTGGRIVVLPSCLATTSYKNIKLWDMQSGGCVETLSGHNHEIMYLVKLPDGRLASMDYKQIKLWTVNTHAPQLQTAAAVDEKSPVSQTKTAGSNTAAAVAIPTAPLAPIYIAPAADAKTVTTSTTAAVQSRAKVEEKTKPAIPSVLPATAPVVPKPPVPANIAEVVTPLPTASTVPVAPAAPSLISSTATATMRSVPTQPRVVSPALKREIEAKALAFKDRHPTLATALQIQPVSTVVIPPPALSMSSLAAAPINAASVTVSPAQHKTEPSSSASVVPDIKLTAEDRTLLNFLAQCMNTAGGIVTQQQLQDSGFAEFKACYDQFKQKLEAAEKELQAVNQVLDRDPDAIREQKEIDQNVNLQQFQQRLYMELSRFIMTYCLASTGILQLTDNKKGAVLNALGSLPIAGAFLKVFTIGLQKANEKYRAYQMNQLTELFDLQTIAIICRQFSRKLALAKKAEIMGLVNLDRTGAIGRLQGFLHDVKEFLKAQSNNHNTLNTTGITLTAAEEQGMLAGAELIERVMTDAKIDKTKDLVPQFLQVFGHTMSTPVAANSTTSATLVVLPAPAPLVETLSVTIVAPSTAAAPSTVNILARLEKLEKTVEETAGLSPVTVNGDGQAQALAVRSPTAVAGGINSEEVYTQLFSQGDAIKVMAARIESQAAEQRQAQELIAKQQAELDQLKNQQREKSCTIM